MELTENQREKIRRYLLGELLEPEQAALEDEYLNDDESFERMVAVENELVDGYARGRLTERERQQFEGHYLAHPDRRERADFARALRARLDQHAAAAAEPVSWRRKLLDLFQTDNWQLGMASAMAVGLLTLGIGSYFLLKRSGPGLQKVAVSETPTPSVPAPPSVQPPVGAPSPAAPEKPRPVFASLVFVAGGLRGEGDAATPQLNLSSDVDFARLQVRIRRLDYATYRASLRSAAGAEVWNQARIKSRVQGPEEIITLTIPANKLAAGDYILALRGVTAENEVDDVSKSAFRVERK